MGNSWSKIGFGSTDAIAMDSACAYVLTQGYKITHTATVSPLNSQDPGARTTKYFIRVTGYGWYHMCFTEYGDVVACSLIWVADDKDDPNLADKKTHRIETNRYKAKKVEK